VTPGLLSRPLYKRFIPLPERTIWYKTEKIVEPNNLVTTQPNEPLEASDQIQKGSGTVIENKTDLSLLTTKDLLDKMRHPNCANVIVKSDKPDDNNDSSVSKKRKIVKPEGKSIEDLEDFKFY